MKGIPALLFLSLVLASIGLAEPAEAQVAIQIDSESAIHPFDVVSVRAYGESGTGYSWHNAPGDFLATAIRTKQLISAAFDEPESRIIGTPSWAEGEFYNIIAKSDDAEAEHSRDGHGTGDNTASPDDAEKRVFRTRLRMLLESRFQMKTHYETKVLVYYALVVDQNRAETKIKPAGNDDCRQHTINLGGKAVCVPMDTVAEFLSIFTPGTPIVNETGLSGNYNFAFDLGDMHYDSPADMWSAILSSIHDIGLNLKKRSGPIKVLVVDHIERPSEN